MTTKMKGLLKGLRYISQIFDTKEHEMQIGYPTDVKHVAHIGWDGPSVSHPSWMNEFRSAPLSPVSDEMTPDRPPTGNDPAADHSSSNNASELPTPNKTRGPPPDVPRPRRQSTLGASAVDAADSPARGQGSIPRRSRRNKSAEGGDDNGGSSAPDSPIPEGPLPKAARKKKPKTGEGSTRSGKTRNVKALASSDHPDQVPEPAGRIQKGSAETFPAVIPSPRRGEEICSV